MEKNSFDICIIGAGAAGLTAAIYAARKNLKAIVLEKGSAGGQTANSICMENYPGFGKVKGKELMQLMRAQAESFGVQIKEATHVQEIKKTASGFETKTDNETIQSKAIILATGTKYKMLNVPGERELYGKGVSYCATCDGPFFRKQRVAVVGGGNSGVTIAQYFDEIAAETFLIEFLPQLNCDEIYKEQLKKTKIKTITNTEVKEILGKENVTGIRIKNRASGKEETLSVDGVFIYVGLSPQNELAKSFGMKLNEKGYIVVNENCETSVPGVFAAGDIIGNLAQTVVAAGQGAIAGVNAYNFVKNIK